ncbi:MULTISPECIES: DUF930 domain-containing protein [unclassified Mesorhizobium]|uniref:DUF930 domain-containing protein n=1 Tax=unclassified Mesorhizobium TaxID=325217 RepID=UPI000F7582B0|nr:MULTISPECIES: DUF930 domain-containing protein [unclassified Mesorhizobium]AZO75737.1 DUF930 domain-containing protein [Mesorhizobium sp. M1D.F.Ca.ET.043.01.1.1]RWA89420.1 MAG: DUF930 domain-containing protein [Mesorhizobium sp.]
MKGETEERRWNLAWALPASLILHVLIAAFLVHGLPRPAQPPDQDQPVNVALVPPPEQPKPKPQPAPQPKEPKAEKPPEQKVEKPPLPEKQPPRPPPIAVLKPVFQYGDKDTGPRKSLDGGGDRDNAPSPAKDDNSKPPAAPKPAEKQSAAPADADQQADPSKADDKPATAGTDAKPTQSEEKRAAQNTNKQQADGQEAGAQTADKPKPQPANALKFKPAKGSKSRSRNAGTPSSTNAAVAGSPIYSGLPGVRKLYSQGATGDALATSSMSGVPRDQRVANLCGSVLNQELQDASYSPKWLPSIPLKVGNVLSPLQTAFSTTTTWYRLSFRCEVDADATRVLSFNFRVGAEIPPGEWARLRLPSLH